jgi:hypothetical protein
MEWLIEKLKKTTWTVVQYTSEILAFSRARAHARDIHARDILYISNIQLKSFATAAALLRQAASLALSELWTPYPYNIDLN